MAIEKLVCSNCRGVLKWNPDDRTFTCENCGTKYQTDNEFTYRIVNEAEIKKLEMEAEEKRLEREKEKHYFRDLIEGLILVVILPLLILILSMKAVDWLF